jgi:RND family efflux transporter MFP subunit
MSKCSVVIAGTLVVLLAACSTNKLEKSAIPVTVRVAEPHKLDKGYRYSANVEPYTTVNIAFKVSGYVAEILQVKGSDGRMRDVQDGDTVKKGVVLAQLRQTEFADRINQAQAHLAEAVAEQRKAKQDLDRASILFQAQSLTKPDYDTAVAHNDISQANDQGAEATLRQAKLDQNDSQLRAPADGILLKRSIEVGSLAAPGTLAFVLADTSAVKVVFGVPDVMVAHTRLGMPLSITSEALPMASIVGRVTCIAPAADVQTRLFEVELTVPNPNNRLRVGMIVSLTVPVRTAQEMPLVVPLTAVVRPKDDPSAYAVYVVEQTAGDSFARLRKVEVGEVYGNLIAVNEGVQSGERVISTGTMLLNDGDKVRLVPQLVPQ